VVGKKAKPEIELHEDAWPRFEQFVRDVARAGPQHRPAKAKPNTVREDGSPKAKAKRSKGR
jgi:hypothetical protein